MWDLVEPNQYKRKGEVSHGKIIFVMTWDIVEQNICNSSINTQKDVFMSMWYCLRRSLVFVRIARVKLYLELQEE